MSTDNQTKALLEQTRFHISDRLQKFLLGFIAIGIIGFVIGLIGSKSYLAWQALLVNTIFFGGIALGGLAFSIIFTITNAKWGRPIKRMAEAMSAFMPIGALLLFLLFFLLLLLLYRQVFLDNLLMYLIILLGRLRMERLNPLPLLALCSLPSPPPRRRPR